MIGKRAKKGSIKEKSREGQSSLLRETLEPPSASDRFAVTILVQAPCNSPNWPPCLLFSHPTLSPKSILHIAARVVCLKFKTELSPAAQNLSTALQIRSCITCPVPIFLPHLTPHSVAPLAPRPHSSCSSLNRMSSQRHSLCTHHSFLLESSCHDSLY